MKARSKTAQATTAPDLLRTAHAYFTSLAHFLIDKDGIARVSTSLYCFTVVLLLFHLSQGLTL